jgi:general secretion pathway protein J
MCFDFSRFYHPGRSLSKGYTLIEVLVAMAIFGSMLTLGGIALNQGLKQYQGLAEKGINFWDQAKEIGIGKSFHSMIDYYVYTRSEGWIPYFRGNENEISYVSLSPLAGTLPVIVWIRKEEGGSGQQSLVYYELPVYTKTYEDIERDLIFAAFKEGKSAKILEGVENLEFRFYGYDLLKRGSTWSRDYEGRKTKILPSAVVVSYTQEGKSEKLVFGTHVNSTGKMIYNETYRR